MDQPQIDALRGHNFLPANVRDIPALDSIAKTELDDITIYLRFFTNAGSV